MYDGDDLPVARRGDLLGPWGILASMDTTLTLDDDIAALLERLRRERGVSLSDLVNETLRDALDRPGRTATQSPFRIDVVDLGEPCSDNVDDISEVLAYLEGEDYR